MLHVRRKQACVPCSHTLQSNSLSSVRVSNRQARVSGAFFRSGRDRGRQVHRQIADRSTGRGSDRCRGAEREMGVGWGGWHGGRERGDGERRGKRERDGEREGETERDRDRETETEMETETDRDRQTDRDRDRGRDRDRDGEIVLL